MSTQASKSAIVSAAHHHHHHHHVVHNWQSDLRFSHVDIIVDDLQGFLNKWCPRLGFVASKVQTWGGPDESTWSEFTLVFDATTTTTTTNHQLMFMVVQGKKGSHVELLQKYGSGSIYRLCFKTNNLEGCFDHLKKQGTHVTNLEGKPYNTFQDVLDSGKHILWLEKEGELSMEILSAPIIDAATEKLRNEVLDGKQRSGRQLHKGVAVFIAVGASFALGVLWERRRKP